VASVDVAGVAYPLRAVTDRASLDAGRPVRLRGCGRLALRAGRDVTLTGSTAPLRVDGLRLSSAAPDPIATIALAGGGRVTDFGREDQGGRSGVRVAVQGPSWLVLGQSYDQGWRARCDGRDLGKPQPVQGYANGWAVDRGCRNVSFAYGPQRLADAGYLVSGLACLGMLVLLAVGASRRRRLAPAVKPADPAPLGDVPPARPLALPVAVAIALPAAVAIGVGFGLRAGAVAAPLLAVLLWRGIGDRAVGVLAGLLLAVVVPAIYLGVALFGPGDVLGGNSTQYGADRLAAHWVGVAAFVALVIVLWRTLAAARVGRTAREVASRR
jgi:hypothetical protein